MQAYAHWTINYKLARLWKSGEGIGCAMLNLSCIRFPSYNSNLLTCVEYWPAEEKHT
jgi:hypothetical protein